MEIKLKNQKRPPTEISGAGFIRQGETCGVKNNLKKEKSAGPDATLPRLPISRRNVRTSAMPGGFSGEVKFSCVIVNRAIAPREAGQRLGAKPLKHAAA